MDQERKRKWYAMLRRVQKGIVHDGGGKKEWIPVFRDFLVQARIQKYVEGVGVVKRDEPKLGYSYAVHFDDSYEWFLSPELVARL